MTEEKKDLSPKTYAVIGLVFTLIAIVILIIGSYALIQAWIWEFPIVLLMFLGLAGFFVAWAIILFYLFVCIMEIKGIKPDDIFPQKNDEQN